MPSSEIQKYFTLKYELSPNIRFVLIFFLEYTRDLRIFVLRREKNGPLPALWTHSEQSCEGLREYEL